jgi:DNA helicase-2/ATP-dependent DNA helicase PcrA
MYSHRNNSIICRFSSKLYPEYSATDPCKCDECRENDNQPHQGIFLVKNNDIEDYLLKYKPMQLRYDKDIQVNEKYPVTNFGSSKGLTFDRVFIYPTDPFIRWMKNNKFNLKPTSRSKFYVAITRARFSVGIACDEEIDMDGIESFIVE